MRGRDKCVGPWCHSILSFSGLQPTSQCVKADYKRAKGLLSQLNEPTGKKVLGKDEEEMMKENGGEHIVMKGKRSKRKSGKARHDGKRSDEK